MYITQAGKSYAEEITQRINEIRSEWRVTLQEGDYNLYKLGFVEDIPCSIKLYVTGDEVDDLVEEIYDMEIAIELSDKGWSPLNSMYARYCCLLGIQFWEEAADEL